MGQRGTVKFTGELLEVLAGAVNGWHKEGPIWFVVLETRGDYFLLADPDGPEGEVAFLSEAEAQRVLEVQSKRTPDEGVLEVQGPYESTLSPEGFGLEVKEVIVEVDKKKQPNREIKPGADMIVWTPAAFNKFVAPYYFRLGSGSAKTYKKIEALRQECFGPEGSRMMIHYWPTRSVGYDDLRETDGWKVV